MMFRSFSLGIAKHPVGIDMTFYFHFFVEEGGFLKVAEGN
jgi:hypothetical protein